MQSLWSHRPTIRDYVLCNERGHELIQGFKVDHSAEIPVHSILKLKLKTRAPKRYVKVVEKSQDINVIFESIWEKKFGEINKKKYKEKEMTESKDEEDREKSEAAIFDAKGKEKHERWRKEQWEDLISNLATDKDVEDEK